MTAWDDYAARLEVHGSTKREASKIRFQKYVGRKLPDNLSYHEVEMSGVTVQAAVINSDNLNQKYIYSMPNETLDLGGLVLYEDNYWLITETDAADEVYTKGIMLQCNYLLKWIDNDDVIHEQWCIVEDGTKLKRVTGTRNSLAYWKRYVKTTPLIAGTPLEPYDQNGTANSRRRQRFKNSMDWAISSQAPNRRRFNDYPGCGNRGKRLEMGSPKPLRRHGEDIVCALVKAGGVRKRTGWGGGLI